MCVRQRQRQRQRVCVCVCVCARARARAYVRVCVSMHVLRDYTPVSLPHLISSFLPLPLPTSHPHLSSALHSSSVSKADVNYAKPTGHTALFYAIAQKDNSVLKVLLKRGADPNSTLKQPDSLGWTPLHFACR